MRTEKLSEHRPKWRRVAKLSGWRSVCAVFLLCAATAAAAPAQTFQTLVDFNGRNGAYPGSIVQSTDGNFYGTTSLGPDQANCLVAGGCGTIFKFTPTGTLTTLYNFCVQPNCADGRFPSELIQATDGNFYGTTSNGGVGSNLTLCGKFGCGTIFELTPSGALTTLYSFCTQANCSDGANPGAGLVQATDGNFYGTAADAGDTRCNHPYGCGTIFKITRAGNFVTLHRFDSTEGTCPTAGLVQAIDGNFYGTTTSGGGCNGSVFKITPDGKLTTLSLAVAAPSGLVQAADGNFYGTTYFGGTYYDGTVFKITPDGTLTTLYSFCAQTKCTDGASPYFGLIQATDDNLYGATSLGGTFGPGTLFKIDSAGTLTTMHNFDLTDGNQPAWLVQGTDGTIYGTTWEGGTAGHGTVFSLSVGLGPFVETRPTSGKVGANIIILGNNLTGTTSVTFNTTAATFTVVGSSEITTTVPLGATSGTVQVTTPGGTLLSNVAFQVKP
jgi:uncharacterized repeat protein (TIGR03803 family)